MNKAYRQGQILKLIRTRRIPTQEDLARELKSSFGIETTQVTLSRDIRDLGLLKTPEGYRQVETAPAAPDLESIAGELLRDWAEFLLPAAIGAAVWLLFSAK